MGGKGKRRCWREGVCRGSFVVFSCSKPHVCELRTLEHAARDESHIHHMLGSYGRATFQVAKVCHASNQTYQF